MDLLQLCEPMFQYICRLSRSARKGVTHDLGQVRSEIKILLEELRGKASGEARLVGQFEKVELALIFFVDFMIKESSLSFAMEWTELAYDRNELAGDEKFFDLLDDTLADPTEEAGERLGIFYTCMGLGFTGLYTGQPEYLRKKMLECSARLRGVIDTDENSRICPDAYQNVDKSDLIEPPGMKLIGIGIALIGLIVVLFVANIFLFSAESKDLSEAQQKILDQLKPDSENATEEDA